jgi:endo-1,4-beta-xylanase
MKHITLHLLFAITFLFFIHNSYGQSAPQATSTIEKGGSINGLNRMSMTVPLADGKSKFLGCEWNYNQASGFEELWNQSTPENAGKWGSVEYSRGSMNWSVLDSTYHVAKRNNMLFKEHTLIWGTQQPSWMASLDSASQRQEIEEWFALLAARYPDIDYIDVVNEPIHTAPNGMIPSGSTDKDIDYANALGGEGATGWDWVITSFKLARKYFPKSKLLINEFSVISSLSTTQKYLKIIKLLQADSLIDGIGEQAHAGTTKSVTVATMKANLDSLAATGLPIYITEMDIDGATDKAQFTEMQRVFSLFWEHPAVAGVTFWGFRDGMWRSAEKAYLITPEGVERPALKWLKAYVSGTLVAMSSLTVTTSSGETTMSKGGTLNMVANVSPENTTFPDVTWTVTPSYLAKIDDNGLLTATAKGTVTVTATSSDGSNVKGSLAITITANDDPGNPQDTTEVQDGNVLYLKDKAGAQTSISLSNISKIIFDSGNMIIAKTSSDSITYGLSSIRYLCFNDLSTALEPIKSLQKTGLIFFPNPVVDELTVRYETTDVEKVQIRIIDLQGRTMFQQTQSSANGMNDVVIPVSQLDKGLYLCRVFTGDKVESIKFYKN